MTSEKQMFSILEDEQSRFIFEKKRAYNSSGNICYIADIVERYLPEFGGDIYNKEKINLMLEQLENKKNIVLFGGGIRCVRLIRELCSRNIKIVAVIDNDKNKQGSSIDGIPILSFDEINIKKVDCFIITPSKEDVINQLYSQIIQGGGYPENIIRYQDYLVSKLEEIQYFDSDIIKFQKQEIFCDVGAHNLETSIKFWKKCTASGTEEVKVYAFEAIPEYFMRCKDIRDQYEHLNIHLYNAAVWNENTKLHFIRDGQASRVARDTYDVEVEAVTLDSCLVNDKVTFIKMDIEGSEQQALQGAKEIIRLNKPKMAISVYHRKNDLIEIPLFIKRLVPEYKLYLRHYSNSPSETVLYAVL